MLGSHHELQRQLGMELVRTEVAIRGIQAWRPAPASEA
jgi:hypothetical protein